MSTQEPTADIKTYKCEDCNRTFLTWQGRNGHRVDCQPTIEVDG